MAGGLPWQLFPQRRVLRARRWLPVLLFFILVVWYLNGINNKNINLKNIRVYVVEEHHEVLRYWYHETVIGNLNRSGNTLIHIDAHPDTALPVMFEGYPFFHWPKGEDYIFNMMQGNDVFIEGAVAIGLVDHIIWIFPSWDESLGPEYELINHELGYMMVTEHGSEHPHFCECNTELDRRSLSPSGQRECLYINKETRAEINLDPDKCHIMKTILMENVVEDLAVEYIRDGRWAKPLKSVMLDIDEDFFGCESGVQILLDSGLPWAAIQRVDQCLSDLICPKYTVHEDVSNRLIKDIITDLMAMCGMSLKQLPCLKSHVEVNRFLHKQVTDMFTSSPEMFCGTTSTEIMYHFSQLLQAFLVLDFRQLLALRKTGFCMSTAPATLDFENIVKFQVCHGYNVPNETVVSLYTPEEREVTERMSRLYQILSQIGKHHPPKVVTLCRSVRDGYTPRLLAAPIEHGILEHFQNERDPNYDVFFDDNLLGGKDGWQGRY